MAIARKIAYNVLVSGIAKVLSTILALVFIGLITRYLGKEGFGSYATVLAFLSFFAALADLGLYQTATREISRPQAEETKIIGKVFSLRVIASAIVFAVSPVIVYFFPYPPEVKKAIVLVAFSFIFSSSYQVLNGIFQKNLSMDRVAVTEFFGKAIQVGFAYLAIKFDAGFLWIVWSLVVNMAVSFFIVYLFSRKYVRFKWEWDFVFWKKFLKESLPLGIAAFVGFFYFKMDTIILSVLKTPAEVGIYNAAYKIIENITFFPAMIIGLIFPIMSKNIFFDRERFVEIANKTFKVFWILVVPLVLGAIFLAEDIIKIVGGIGFSESAGVLKIIIFALAAIFFGNFFNFILISGNKQKQLMKIMAIAAVFNVTANLIFIPRYSYLAAAFIAVITEFFVVISQLAVAKKRLDYFPKLEGAGRVAFSGAVMAIFFLIFRGQNFFWLAPLSAVVYFLSLWATGAVKAAEITSIISKKPIIN